MSYDDWKLESPEDEAYRIGRIGMKQRKRAEWMEEHADDLRDQKIDDDLFFKVGTNYDD